MKIRNLLFALIALSLVSTGLVYANSAVTETPVAATEIDAPVEIETAAEVLESLDAKGEDRNVACCIADCFDAFSDCTTGCSDPGCFQACRGELRDCRNSC